MASNSAIMYGNVCYGAGGNGGSGGVQLTMSHSVAGYPVGGRQLTPAAVSHLFGAQRLDPNATVHMKYDIENDRYKIALDDGSLHRVISVTREELQGLETYVAPVVTQVVSRRGWPYVKKKFPRPVAERLARMNRLIRWRRQKLRERHLIHAGIALGILAVVPVIAALISELWKFAISVIMG